MSGMPRGFTLVELLVVTLLALILMVLVLPRLIERRVSGARIACASNLSQIGKALIMYADSAGNNIFPSGSASSDPFADFAPLLALQRLYRGYAADARVFHCPGKKQQAPEELQRVSDWRPGRAIEIPLTAAACSYGYDPGHRPDDVLAAIAADRANGKNSRNHGPEGGQNVLFGDGHFELLTSPRHELGQENGRLLVDTDIYGLDKELSRALDGYIRQ